jgi:hypothetical protein
MSQYASLAAIILFGSLSHAQNSQNSSTLSTNSAAAPTSMREMAMAAAQVTGKEQKVSTDAQVAGSYLTLKDPRPEIVGRSWKYFAGLSFQNFQAEGSASNDSAETFDLGKNDSTVMPSIKLGAMTTPWATGPMNWQFGARGQASFASQETSGVLKSGYQVDDARLNSILLSVGPVFALSWQRLAWLSFTFSPQWGTLNYTQSSSNDLAKFSKQAGYEALHYGLDFQIGTKWSVFTEYSNRTLRDGNEQVGIQANNFELGTKVQW